MDLDTYNEAIQNEAKFDEAIKNIHGMKMGLIDYTINRNFAGVAVGAVLGTCLYGIGTDRGGDALATIFVFVAIAVCAVIVANHYNNKVKSLNSAINRAHRVVYGVATQSNGFLIGYFRPRND